MVLFVASTLPAQDRELHWRRMHVEARLDRDGVLHVKETQTIVFTGDWNGGERAFDYALPQRFTFERLARLDTLTGREIPMHEGDLDVVDGFDWGDSHRLRWRARLPEDPPFNADERTYRLEFRYANILLEEGESEKRYRLDHDFAFTDHQGAIQDYTLKLTLDPVWRAPADFTGEFGPLSLEPWYGYVVNIPLTFTGEGRPAGVVSGAQASQRTALAGAFVLVLVALTGWFLRREAGLGRFAPLESPDAVDEPWLERVVFANAPEVVGAAWDESTGAAEVTAMLARLEKEGKIKSRVETKKLWIFSSNTLHMELTVPRGKLRDHERSLIDGLFFNGRTEVSTDDIREHYSRTGFNPAGKIESRLQQLVDAIVTDDAPTPVPSWIPTLVLILAGGGVIFSNVRARPYDLIVALPGLFGALIAFVPMLAIARGWRDRVDGAAGGLLWLMAPLVLLSAAFVFITFTGFHRVGITALAGLALVLLGVAYGTFRMAMWRKGTQRLQLRRAMATARRFFAQQLRTPEPRLKDEWFPWLIGLGLASQMDGWFRAFGGSHPSATHRASSMSTGSSWS
ncbi:MAG TPA: DUF2207 domain-containing protein, partial [Gemmatimonadaceae bacterium]|nr:DUF2207 domain-containing protein [Gemmatimonadaceae bacterium]